MMKTTTRMGIRLLAILIAAMAFTTCDFPNTGAAGRTGGGIRISFPSLTSDAKTVLPVFAVHHYDIVGTGPTAGDQFDILDSTAESVRVDSLAGGSWTVTVYGRNAEGATVARGTAQTTVEVGKMSDCPVSVGFLQEGSGNLSISLQWPLSAGIDSIVLAFDGTEETVPIASGGNVYAFTRSGAASGAHLLFLNLRKGGQTCASVVRSIHVYDYLDSAESVLLSEGDFKAAPAAPSGLSATVGAGCIELSWTDGSYVETGFVVERSAASGTGFGDIGAVLPANASAYSDAAISFGATYYYRVKAVNLFGGSSYSDEASCTVVVPEAPVPTGHAKAMVTNPKITWPSVSGAAGYRHQMDTETGPWTETSRTHAYASGVSDGAHTMYVQAGDGHGNWSASGTFPFQVHWTDLRTINDSINNPHECYESVMRLDHLYMLVKNRGLVVYYVPTDSAAPQEVGCCACDHVPSGTNTIEISGNCVYFMDGYYSDRIRIIDVTDPANPLDAGYLTTFSQVSGIYVSGSLLYVLFYNANPAIYGLGNPVVPEFKTRITSVPGGEDAYVHVDSSDSKSWLFIAGGSNNKLYILDMTDSLHPTLANSISFPADVRAVTVDNQDYGYLIEGQNMVILDLQSPGGTVATMSTITDNTGNTIYPNTLTLIGSYIYLSNGSGGHLYVINVADPAFPSIVASDTIDTKKGHKVHRNDHHAYMSDASGGYMVLDITDNAAPSVVLKTGSTQPKDVAVSGSYAYFAAGEAGLQIVDVSDPLSASVVKTLTFGAGSDVSAVHISGNTLYAGDFACFRVVDISDPTLAHLDSTVSTVFSPLEMTGTDSCLYAGGGGYNLQVWNVSSPSAPSLEKTIGTMDGWVQVSVSGNYAYLAASYSGLRIIDIGAASLINTVDTQRAYGVAAANGYAYLADESGSVFVYDVSSPSTVTTHTCSVANAPYGTMTMIDDYLFVASTWFTGFGVVDIINPATSFLACSYSAGSIRKLVPSGEYLYGVDAVKGLVILGD